MFFPGFLLAAAVGLPQNPPVAVLGDEVTLGYSIMVGEETIDSTEKRPPLVIELGKRDFNQGHVLLPIPGLDKQLVGLAVGESRSLDIPAGSGFGDLAVGEIPAGSALKMNVKVLYVQKKGSTPAITIEESVAGTGEGAKAGQTVEVHYKGTFLNGIQFDSSYDRNATFSVELGAGRVIPGFDQGLAGMKVGSKRKVTIPYQLAYGAAGRAPSMPPKSTLVFELELISIK